MQPRDRASRQGTTPWNTVLVPLRFSSVKFIFCSVSRYMMLMLLPLSTMHLVNSTPSINGLMTMAYWFSVGTRAGWSVLFQVIGTSDQRRYWGTGGRVAIRILRGVFCCRTVGVPRKVWYTGAFFTKVFLPLSSLLAACLGSMSSSMSLESVDSSSFFFPFPLPRGLFFRLCL